MFTRTLLFALCFVGIFTLVFVAIPDGFFTEESKPDANVGVDPEISESFTFAGMVIYSTAGNDSMTYQYSSLYDAPDPPQWNVTMSDYLEVWWGDYTGIHFSGKYLQFRHATYNGLWWDSHPLNIYESDGYTKVPLEFSLDGDDLEDNWNDDTNASAFYLECDHIVSSVLVGFNHTSYSSISEAWDNDELDYILSYEKNWNATGTNAISLLAQLLTFQNPDLGVPGLFGTVLNACIAIPFVIIIAIAIIKLLQSVLPIKGVDD